MELAVDNIVTIDVSITALITYTVRVVECTIAMELTLVEVALVDDSVGELELAHALRPIVFRGTCKITS
jgi:hypothetical protein